jgi:hypothetical protein
MHVVSFVLLSSVLLFVAVSLRAWLGGWLFLALLFVSALQFAYMAIAIRRFYLVSGTWSGWVMSVAAALFIYVLNSAFMTAVQVAGDRPRLDLGIDPSVAERLCEGRQRRAREHVCARPEDRGRVRETGAMRHPSHKVVDVHATCREYRQS